MSEFSVLDLSTEESVLVLTAVYQASPERVFEAWLNPEAIKRWVKSMPTCETEVLKYDPHDSGEFAVHMHIEGEVYGYHGVFTQIDPPRRLEMTWTWDPTPNDPYPETHLTIDLEPAGSGTRLTLTHSKIRSLESREAHSEGWTGSLTELNIYFH
jgi:uncharacterized protein YndB with AHSA1/START domain